MAAGDVDGEVGEELIVGAPTDGQFEGGSTLHGYVYAVSAVEGGGPLDTSAVASFTGDSSYLDALGTSVSGGVDVDGDGYEDVAIGAPFAGNVVSGAVYVAYGPQSGESRIDLRADAFFLGDEGARAGTGVTLGDLDGDGTPDLGVGVTNLSTYPMLPGEILIFNDPHGALERGEASARIAGSEAQDGVGFSFASVGDVDGDGVEDAAVGAPGLQGGSGAAYLMLGPIVGDRSVDDADLTVTSSQPAANLGQIVAPAADLDEDGLPDLLIGAWQDSAFEKWAGKTYVVSGTLSGGYFSDDIPASVAGEMAYDMAGGALASLGDTDGDGHAEIAVGMKGNGYFSTSPGKVYVFSAPIRTPLDPAADSVAIVQGENPGDGFGQALAPHDIDRDGVLDILVAAPFNADGGVWAGKVYLILGTAFLAE